MSKEKDPKLPYREFIHSIADLMVPEKVPEEEAGLASFIAGINEAINPLSEFEKLGEAFRDPEGSFQRPEEMGEGGVTLGDVREYIVDFIDEKISKSPLATQKEDLGWNPEYIKAIVKKMPDSGKIFKSRQLSIEEYDWELSPEVTSGAEESASSGGIIASLSRAFRPNFGAALTVSLQVDEFNSWTRRVVDQRIDAASRAANGGSRGPGF